MRNEFFEILVLIPRTTREKKQTLIPPKLLRDIFYIVDTCCSFIPLFGSIHFWIRCSWIQEGCAVCLHLSV